mgnify:CR=1 FL=1
MMTQIQANQEQSEALTHRDKSLGKEVYLDRDQCRGFGVEYFSKSNFYLTADVLLNSKDGDGYDTTHHNLLQPLGIDYIVLSRQHGEKPGWFKIDNIVTAGH